jgi:hypothetical protein
VRPYEVSQVLIALLVPLGVAVTIGSACIYDVPGGFRAVMFDRFSGVREKVLDSSKLLHTAHVQGTGKWRRNSLSSSLAPTCHPLRLPYQAASKRPFCLQKIAV